MELMNAKGTRDFPPEEKIIRQQVIDRLRAIFELYGYSPLETPILERFDILASKYAGGDEILKETFKFNDQGERDLGLRYDLTIPFARFVGMNPTLKMPFKRYQIGEVFRDGPIKLGRFREFLQCDVDIVGTKSMLADAECIRIAQAFFKDIGFDVIIEVNNRKLLDGILESLGIPQDKWTDVILGIDKLKKIGVKGVEEELKQKGIEGKEIDALLRVLKTEGKNSEKVEKLRKFLKSQKGIEGLNELEELFSYTYGKNVVFSISLARGLAYYTGTVFEVFMSKGEFTSSLAGGGRYDKMIGEMLGTGREYPAVGISFGIEPITAMLKVAKKEIKKTVTQIYIIPIKTAKKCIDIAQKLRAEGINVDMDLAERGISKNLDYANSLGIPYVLFVGEQELKANKVKLRDMKTGKEKMAAVDSVAKYINNKI